MKSYFIVYPYCQISIMQYTPNTAALNINDGFKKQT